MHIAHCTTPSNGENMGLHTKIEDILLVIENTKQNNCALIVFKRYAQIIHKLTYTHYVC